MTTSKSTACGSTSRLSKSPQTRRTTTCTRGRACTCLLARACAHTRTAAHARACACTRMHGRACEAEHPRSHVRTQMHTHTRTCADTPHTPHAHTHARTHAQTRSHTHTHARAYACTPTHARARARTRTRARVQARAHTDRYIYYPESAGGGSKRLFRKVRHRHWHLNPTHVPMQHSTQHARQHARQRARQRKAAAAAAGGQPVVGVLPARERDPPERLVHLRGVPADRGHRRQGLSPPESPDPPNRPAVASVHGDYHVPHWQVCDSSLSISASMHVHVYACMLHACVASPVGGCVCVRVRECVRA
jgi:hypothetical protein